jgi:asparagine synthase (glutamine-hydrolysing)
MSVICGVICLDGNPVPREVRAEMMNKLVCYPVDDFGEWIKGEVFLGNAIRYVTSEDQLEKLPYFHSETELAITADAIIDNRKELLNIFKISKEDWQEVTDSKLILMAYIKWGEDCPKYLIGDYAFAIWNSKKKELFCARDHVGKRTFYFYHSSNIFAFCTVIEPLLHVIKDSRALNEAWIADFLSVDGPINEIDCSSTIYKDIQQLLPAHYFIIDRNKSVKKRYWDPLHNKQLKLNSDEEYEEAFREVFSEAVNCRLRSIGSIGVMLSGGLDSGAVACVAAEKLKKKNGVLKAFSSVPFSGYKNWLPKNVIADEREYIEKILRDFNNIDITYCDCEGINSYNSIDRLLGTIEHPYNTIQNLFWIDEIASKATGTGCSVLLDGQFGNFTISFGNIETYLITLFKQCKWRALIRAINEFSNLHGYKRDNVLRYFFTLVAPNSIKSVYKWLKGIKTTNIKDELNSVVNHEFAVRQKVNERLKKAGLGPYYVDNKDMYNTRKFNMGFVPFSQTGDMETKISLQYGIIKRDPTRDKRVIDFCMSMPMNQFVNKGEERSLIRRAMNGILPEEVRLNYYFRGTQADDWIQRLLPVWKNIKEELESVLDNNFGNYLDTSKVRKNLEIVGEVPRDDLYANIQRFISIIILKRFISKIEDERR